MFTTIIIGFLLALGLLLFIAGKRAKVPELVTEETPGKYGTVMTKDNAEAVENAKNVKRAAKGAGVVLVLIGALILFFSTFTIVQGYETGVPVSFGNVGKSMSSGVHFVAPWTSVETYPKRPLTVPNVEVVARTAQSGQFTVTLGARWYTENGSELYYQMRTGDEDTITSKVVDPAEAQAIQNVYSKLTNQQAINDRTNVESLLLAETQRQLDRYGIKVDAVFLRSSEPDQHTSDVLAQLTSQQQQTEIAKAAQQTAVEQGKVQKQQADNLTTAANSLPGNLTPQQQSMLCAQIWERVVSAAVAKGVAVYTSPCAGSATAVIAK